MKKIHLGKYNCGVVDTSNRETTTIEKEINCKRCLSAIKNYRIKIAKEKQQQAIIDKNNLKIKKEKLINGYIKKITEQSDSISDGWLELVIDADDKGNKEFTLKLPRIPFERWSRGARQHRWDEWDSVAHCGLKMQMDDTDHSDWWLMTGVPIEYSYGETPNKHSYYYPKDDPDYEERDPKEQEYVNLAKRINDAVWQYKWKSTKDRKRNSIFLSSNNEEIEGWVMHVKSIDDILDFVDEAQRWKTSCNSRKTIAVVPNCSVEYDAIVRNADAIITEIGSAAAHLVKVAREDNIPVIYCPNAFNEYFNGERITIHKKDIWS